MTQDVRPKQHRKFIALILAASLAVTGVSAVPAQAGSDAGKIFAGLAVLGILGAALHDHNTRDRGHTVSRLHPPQGGYQPPHTQRPHHPTPKPLPPRFGRYDLPKKCVKVYPRYSLSHSLVGANCLERNAQQLNRLPQACRVSFWNGRQNRTAYKPQCLNQHGYRLVNR
jgi:hypothetical protein